MAPSFSAKHKLFFALLISLIPMIIMLRTISIYKVDLPFWDQWNFVPLLGQSYEEGVSIPDLWEQHNEHRLLFPRAIMLALAHATGYSITAELIVIILLICFNFGMLIYIFRRHYNDREIDSFPWVIPAIALILFSLGQGENLIWGWQIQILLNLSAIIVGSFLLTKHRDKPVFLVLAILSGFIATYSFANGLIFWPLGLLYLIIDRNPDKSKHWRGIAAWAVASAAIIFSYLYHFSLSQSPTDTFYFIKHPIAYLEYIFKYLGAPISNYPIPALLCGLLGTAFFFFATWKLVIKNEEDSRFFHIFILLGFYAGFSAAMSGLGRLEFGAHQAMSYRYTSISSLLWVANSILLFFLINRYKNGILIKHSQRVLQVVAIIIIVFMAISLIRTSYRVGYSVLRKYHETLEPIRKKITSEISDEDLKKVYIHTEHVRYCLGILNKNHLSVYREK
ncbi:MAG: hypothetical protein JW737_07700 [Acidobacteria bacterium]|nr:hypothetical protein [Acidobacteriota bacterium]